MIVDSVQKLLSHITTLHTSLKYQALKIPALVRV